MNAAPVRVSAMIAPADGVASCAIHTPGRRRFAMKRSPVLRLDMRRVLTRRDPGYSEH